MSARWSGLVATAAVVVLLVFGAGMALGADTGTDRITASGASENVSAAGADGLEVVGFDWPTTCPDEGTEGSVLNEYFDGDIGPSDEKFHIDNADGADEDPPGGGCVLRTEGDGASIVSTPGGQLKNVSYYPQRGDTVSWNHYVQSLDPLGGSNPADFEFRFGLQDPDNYYFVTVAANKEPLELALGEVSGGSVVTENRVGIGNTLEAGTFQPVEVAWGETTIEATFDGIQTVSIDSTSFDDGGIGFSRVGTQGIVNSYANLVDAVTADTASHLQIESLDFPESVAPGEDLTVEYTLTNQGEQTATESEVGLFVGPEKTDTDLDVAVAPGETTSGTLTYGNSGEFEENETIGFTVELADWNDSEGGSTVVAEPAELVVDLSTEPPSEIQVEESLALDYVVENVGGESADGVVQLSVDAENGFPDLADVSLDPGEAEGGTLVYDNVSNAYEGGDTIDWEVGLASFPDSETGTTTVLDPPEFVLTAVDAPDTVGIEDALTVEYTVTNEGGQPGTESFVDLYVDGEFVDTDENISLVPGESYADTLTFESVGENYEGGETINWTVALFDFGDSAGGQTGVTEGPIFELTSIDPPEEVGLNEDLVFNYTVENTGDVRGTESAVELLVDGSLADVDEDLLLLPGEQTNGTLVYEGVASAFGPGEKIPLTVGLSKFEDTVSAETDITEADGPGELYFTVDPPNPKAGDDLQFEAGHYNSSKYYFWLVEDEEIASGTAATTVITEPGTYNITLVESDIPTSPFDGDADTEVFDSVTKEVELGEGDIVVSETQLQGLDSPIFPELEEERPVELTIETTEDQEFESVSVEVDGVTTPLVPTDTFGATRTYTGNVNINNVEADTEATVTLEAFGASYSDTKQVAVRDTPEWLGTVLEYGEQYGPIEETDGGYSLTLDLFDTTVVVDSGTSPYWDEDINVTLAGSGTFAITPQAMDFSASVTGGAGIAGTQATANIDPSASFGYNLSLLEAETVTSILLERDLFQQDIGLDPLYENLPSPVADKLPSCVVGAEASIQGELTHYMQFIDGLHPIDDLEEMALEGQPTLPVGAEATCGPASVTLDSAPTAEAAVLFEPELPPKLEGAGATADVTVNGELEIDLWFFSGSESASWNLFSWEAIEGENPFIDDVPGPESGDRTGDGGLVRQPAGGETTPLSGVPSVDAGVTTDALSPASASGTTVRLTNRVFDDTDPALATLGDEFALLWSSEPAASGQQEPSDLSVRVGSGTDWGDPVTITDNDNHEGEPALAAAGDGSTLAAWAQFEDADRDIGEIEDQFFQSYEIAVAAATNPADNSSWSGPTPLTDGDAYEYAPTVKSVGNNEWLVVWDRNTAANLSNLTAEEVGYALVSTAGDGVTVLTQGTIADARAPDVGVSDGEVSLAFHRPGNSLADGQVVRGTFDPATATFQPVESHPVSGFTDLAAAGDRVVWADGPASNPSVSTAVGTAPAAQTVPLSTQTTRLTDLELATWGDRTVLTYQADAPRSETTERDLFVQVTDGDGWSNELQLARTALDGGSVTLSGASPVATGESAVVPYVVSQSAVNSSEDLFLVERPYEPTHALNATIDAPENVSVGDGVSVKATVENVAVSAGSEPTTVAVTDGETTVESVDVGPLGPGETTTVELTPAVPATGELVVTVDGATRATDDGTFNQTAAETLLTPALAPGASSATRLNESTSELSVTVENTGEVDAEPTTIALREAGETVATAAVPAVPGGDGVTVTTTFEPDALNRSNSETLVLDPAGDLEDAAIERSTRSVWAGQPDVVVTEDIEYRATGSGTIVASLVLGNEGSVGATVSLSAVDQSTGETVGRSSVALPPATQSTTPYRTVSIPLQGVAENDTVLFDATPVDRPDADTGTTGVWDEVAPVLAGFTLDPVVDSSPPQDLDGDGRYRDIDGDDTFDIFDVQALFDNLGSDEIQQNAWAFDFDGDDEVTILDVQALFNDLVT